MLNRSNQTGRRTKRVALLLRAALLLAPWLAGTATGPPEGDPRVVVLFMDGVPFRAAVAAVEQGAFDDWPPPKVMLAPFPSMTNVSFTAMMMPLGMDPVQGYEVRHFDVESNRTTSGVFNYDENKAGWRDVVHVQTRKKRVKAANYFRPAKTFWKLLGRVEDWVLKTDEEPVLAHISSTDIYGHWNSGDSLVPFIVQLSDWVDDLDRRHRELYGRPLRFYVLSDHGNTTGRVLHTKGIHDPLREAGLRVTSRLEKPDDVVAPTYGVVNFGVLFLRQELAETAARAVATHEAVDLAAWISGPSELSVVGRGQEARVRWRDQDHRRFYSYERIQGDLLLLADTLSELELLELLDENGFAADEDWFKLSLFTDFPDAPRRLVESLTRRHVSSAATVIFSLDPHYALGTLGAQIGVRLVTGHLEGTHGGLDRDSSLGFFLTNDPDCPPGLALRADEALLDLESFGPLRTVLSDEKPEDEKPEDEAEPGNKSEAEDEVKAG